MLGRPAICTEIIVVFQMNYTKAINSFIFAMLQNLYREDLYYVDKEFVHYSMEGPDGTEAKKHFEKFSERFLRQYPGYILDKHMHIVAKPGTPVLNLRQLMELFKSKDEELWQRCKWMFDGQFRFLDGEPNPS